MGSTTLMRGHQTRRASPLLACLVRGRAAGWRRGGPGAWMPEGRTRRRRPSSRNFFDSIVRWFGQQAENFKSNIKNAGAQSAEFRPARPASPPRPRSRRQGRGRRRGAHSHRAHDLRPREMRGGAQRRARLHGRGHERMCKSKGFESGKSVDMTTAEVCPAQVYLAGRNSGPGCHDRDLRLPRALPVNPAGFGRSGGRLCRLRVYVSVTRLQGRSAGNESALPSCSNARPPAGP